MTETNYEDGSFADVVWDDGFWVAYQTDPRSPNTEVIVQHPDGRIRYTFPTNGEGAAFPRLGVWDGQLYLAYRRQNEIVVHCFDDGWEDDMPTAKGGNDPVALGGGFVVWNDASLNRMLRRPLRGGRVEDAGKAVGTGISFVGNTGQVFLVDDVRTAFAGHTLPQWAGPYVVGELPDNNGITIQREETGIKRRKILWPGLPVFVPRIALAPDGTIAVASAGAGHVRLVTLRDNELSAAQPGPVDPPSSPNLPNPPMSVPNRIDAVRAAAARYPREWKLAHKDYGSQDQPGRASRADAELFIRLLAYDLYREDRHFGLNGKRGNVNDLSQDVLCYKHDDGFESVIDVIAGAGGDNPSEVWNVVGDHLPPGPPLQAWIEPRPVSGSVDPPSQPPTQPPAQPPSNPPTGTQCRFAPAAPVDLSPILTELTTLRNDFNALRTFVENDGVVGRLLVLANKVDQVLTVLRSGFSFRVLGQTVSGGFKDKAE